MRKTVCLSEIVRSYETLDNISYFTLISLCESMCYEFIKRREVGKPICYSDEHAVECDLTEGEILSGSLDMSFAIVPGQQPFASVKFIAPEILRGEETSAYRASLYTLCVLLFRLLTLSFPYEGEAFAAVDGDSADEVKLFYTIGSDFIFDKKGKNRARFGSQDTAIAFWEIYPSYIKQAFIRSFHNGGDERLSEEEWLELLRCMKHQLSVCPECGAEMFFEALPAKCWRCLNLTNPYRIKLTEGGKVILDETACCGMTVDGKNYKFETVVRNMKWGVKNHLERVWKWKKTDGHVVTVEKNKAVPLKIARIILTEDAVLSIYREEI